MSKRQPADQSNLARPIYFGSDSEPLFGHLHLPELGATPRIPVLLCAAHGHEYMAAHRSLRVLAEQLAASGAACLRFDYLGCGDSADGVVPDAVQGLARWPQDIGQAIDQLKAITGAPQVVLVGLRLGATMAALAAHRRSDIAGLVAIAPVLKGRSYVRECKALGISSLDRSGLLCTAAPGTLESGGFVLTAADIAYLSGVELLKLDERVAPRLLILECDHLPQDASWQEQQAALGAQVQRQPFTGYEAMMQVPHLSQLPLTMLAKITAWATALRGPDKPLPINTSGLTSHISLSTQGVQEHALWLPAESALSALSAVLSTPLTLPDGPPRGSRGGLLLLNTGGEHRVGPNAIYTKWARQWAARGWTVMRLDLAGLGNSPAQLGRQENEIHIKDASASIRRAQSYLQTHHGVTDLHLIGLCSGAFHSLTAAFQGVPVRSVTAINQMTYFWQDHMPVAGEANDAIVVAIAQGAKRSLIDPVRWKKLFRGEVDVGLILRAVGRRLRQKFSSRLQTLARRLRLPFAHDLNAALLRTAARGVDLHLVFSAKEPGLTVLQEQGRYALERLSGQRGFSLTVLPHADHTFTQAESQRRLFDAVDRGLRQASRLVPSEESRPKRDLGVMRESEL